MDIEGTPFLTNYDPIADVGTMTATIKTALTSVTDDTLNIFFSAVVNNAKISAIEIIELTGSGPTLSVVPAGTYTVNVSDANGCSTSQTVTLTEPDLLVAAASADQDESCTGSANGQATASATGDPDQAALYVGRGVQVDLEPRGGRKPVDDDHQGADRQDRGGDAGPPWRQCDG